MHRVLSRISLAIVLASCASCASSAKETAPPGGAEEPGDGRADGPGDGRADGPGDGPGAAAGSTYEPMRDASPAPSPEARDAKLAAACGDVAKFADVARETSRGALREALELYRSRGAGAGKAMTPEVRAAVEDIARAYMELCALAETIELTSKLVEFPTVSAREPATGESFRGMSDALAAWTKDAGFDYRVSGENDAWEVSYGRGPASVAFVMHGDVVPIDDGVKGAKGAIDALTGEPLPAGWTKPPFRTTLTDGRLYGRGTEDDKGPIAAVLIVMRTMAKLGLEPAGRVQAVIGTGEEHDWTGMKRYVDSLRVKPAFVISVDANFPVVIAESGFVAWQLSAPVAPAKKKAGKCTNVTDVKAGQFLTQVPGEAMLALSPAKGERFEKFRARVEAGIAAATQELGDGYRLELVADADKIELRAFGEAVHSSVADEGKNAMWALAVAAGKIDLCPGGVATMLSVVAKKMAGDHWGTKLGLAYEDAVMGKLLVVPTLLRIDAGEAKLGVNMRRPRGMSGADFGKKLDETAAALKKEFGDQLRESGDRYVGDPATADTSGPLVPTLMEIYKKMSGDEASTPISVRGGTYARLFQGAVSFGPSLPNTKYAGHAPDEFIETKALHLLDRALLEVVLRLDPLAAKK